MRDGLYRDDMGYGVTVYRNTEELLLYAREDIDGSGWGYEKIDHPETVAINDCIELQIPREYLL